MNLSSDHVGGYQRKRSSIKINEIDEDVHKDLEEEDDMMSVNERVNMDKSKGILFPDSSFRAFWDFMVLWFVIYSSLLLPFQISFTFTVPHTILVTDIMSDTVFLLDIFLSFCTGIYDKGVLLMSRDAIIKKYMSFWFWLDLLASFPYTWIMAAS